MNKKYIIISIVLILGALVGGAAYGNHYGFTLPFKGSALGAEAFGGSDGVRWCPPGYTFVRWEGPYNDTAVCRNNRTGRLMRVYYNG